MIHSADRLSVVVVTETWPPEVNGVAMTTARLVAGLRERGHRVEVVRPRRHRGDDGAALEAVVPGLPLPGYAGLRFGLPARRMLHAAWCAHRPDVVHVVTEGPLGWSAVSAARRLGIPVSAGFHTHFDHYSAHYRLGWARPLVSGYLSTFHRRAQATLVPTAALAAELDARAVPGVEVVGRGVDTALFAPTRRSTALRRAWGVGDDALLCVHVGRIAAEKNLDTVLAAFDAIRAVRADARMLWVGDGPRAAWLRAHRRDHVFAGIQHGEALARCYASADLFVFPSLTETFGNVLAEAMASGLAVLAYRRAAAVELVSDDVSGVVVAPGDRDAFVRAAAVLGRDDARRARLGAAAHRAMQARGWDAVVVRFESVLRRLVAERGATDAERRGRARVIEP
ncbi:MAG TPA: glycosyltransferase family 1 protein [Rhodocyclaceae bacterium]|nr:glycosyltransferase family 1 protein [Rhodocyclaceae bacterium]